MCCGSSSDRETGTFCGSVPAVHTQQDTTAWVAAGGIRSSVQILSIIPTENTTPIPHCGSVNNLSPGARGR